MRRIRVLIVEDSPVVREVLRQIISADARLEVVSAVESAEEALAGLDRFAPDVISLDIRLPGMQGIEATRRIMSLRPTPIVVVSGASESEETNLSMEALKAGALAVVEKPVGTGHADYAALAQHLCTQLAIMSEVRVIRQRVRDADRAARRAFNIACPCAHGNYRLLGIVASTGGPSALMELLAGLGRDFPLPIVVAQHMTPTFIPGFSAWLKSVVPFSVEMVSGKAPLAPRHIYLAAPGYHLLADGQFAWTEASAPMTNHRPSGSVLFGAMARHVREAGIGVLLTGMGEDGAEGLRELREAGGYTIAEDESTAVVYGMPAAGVRLGAVCESLPLPAIASRVLQLTGVVREVA